MPLFGDRLVHSSLADFLEVAPGPLNKEKRFAYWYLNSLMKLTAID